MSVPGNWKLKSIRQLMSSLGKALSQAHPNQPDGVQRAQFTPGLLPPSAYSLFSFPLAFGIMLGHGFISSYCLWCSRADALRLLKHSALPGSLGSLGPGHSSRAPICHSSLEETPKSWQSPFRERRAALEIPGGLDNRRVIATGYSSFFCGSSLWWN